MLVIITKTNKNLKSILFLIFFRSEAFMMVPFALIPVNKDLE